MHSLRHALLRLADHMPFFIIHGTLEIVRKDTQDTVPQSAVSPKSYLLLSSHRSEFLYLLQCIY